MTLPVLLPVVATTVHSAASAFADIVDTLRDLPDDPDKIAGLLKDIGIKGCPCSGTGCALAEYVRGVVWPEDDVDVSIMDMALHVEFGDVEFLYSLPSVLAKFVMNFDNGKYPELMAKECVQ